MGWEALGAIAELVSAAAVLATLVYLGHQIRQNSSLIDQQNKIAKSQNYQQRADSVAQLVSAIMGNEENAEIMIRLMANRQLGPEDLTPEERVRATLLIHPLRANLENTYLQYRDGYLPENFYREVVENLFAPYASLFFAFDVPLEKDFRQELLRILSERKEMADERCGLEEEQNPAEAEPHS